MVHSWRSLSVAVVMGIVTLICVDATFHYVAPPRHWRQVNDGVRDFRNGNPRVLSLSSSHGRSMDILGRHLAALTGDPESMVSVAMEGGNSTHFQFVLNERLKPLIEESTAGGGRKRDRLKSFLLVTEWWDSCQWPADRQDVMVQSHAWTWHHFLSDAFARGITPANRNFLRWQWREASRQSSLVSDRGPGAIPERLIASLLGRAPGRSPEEEREFNAWWQQYNETGNECLFHEDEMRAYSNIVDYAKAQGLDVTIVLFVRKPSTLTRKALDTTIARFSNGMNAFAREKGVRLIDITTRSPLSDEDFMADFDHVNAAGNLKLADWLLRSDLAFLRCEHANCPSYEGQKTSFAGNRATAVGR